MVDSEDMRPVSHDDLVAVVTDLHLAGPKELLVNNIEANKFKNMQSFSLQNKPNVP